MITLGKVFCSKANPNCKACPMQKECEYALNNGPSLHGRKRTKVTPTVGSGEHDGNGANIERKLAAASRADGHSSGNSVHWRTQQKLERLARELEEHQRRYSTLSLDELVSRHSKGLRTYGLRRPRGMEGVEASDSLPRLKVELSLQARLHRHNHSLFKPIRWFPIAPLRNDPAVSPSIWDIEDLNELAGMKSWQRVPDGKTPFPNGTADTRPDTASIWDLEGYSAPHKNSMQPSNENVLHEEFVAPFTPSQVRFLHYDETMPVTAPIVKKSKPVVDDGRLDDGRSRVLTELNSPSPIIDLVMEDPEPRSSEGWDGMPNTLARPSTDVTLDVEIECSRILKLGEEIAKVVHLRPQASQPNDDNDVDDQLSELISFG